MSAEAIAAANRGAARALGEVLRRRRPDLAWEVTIGPRGRLDREPAAAGAGKVRRSEAGGHDASPLGDRPASLPDPDHRKRAA